MNTHFIPLDAVSSQPFDLDSIQIAKPCRADWEQMSGDARARHCGSCAKNVYNLSTLTRAEAARLVQEKEGHLCVRLHRRADGTVLTSDCTVGISPLKKGRRLVRTFVAAAVAALLSWFGASSVRASGVTKPQCPAPTAAPLMGKPTMGAPRMAEPEMGEPRPTVTLGVIAPPRPVKITPPVPRAKPVSNHGKNTAKSARKGNAKQHRRYR